MGPDKFLLKHSSKYGNFASIAAVQIKYKSNAIKKIPHFVSKGCLFTKRSLEQCSSEKIAAYKAGLFSGKKFLSLASGLGIDDLAFAKRFNSVVSIDNDPLLNEIVEYNLNCLGLMDTIQRKNIDAVTFIKQNSEHFDLIYIDPDRRNDKGRQILLREHSPNCIELMPFLMKISDCIVIKCSPLYDYEMAKREIPELSKIHCISIDGEVKEMLIEVNKKKSETENTISCVDLKGDSVHLFECLFNTDTIPLKANELHGYLYEAGACIIKMRKHHTYAQSINLQMIDNSIGFYIGDDSVREFIGRKMKIIHSMPYKTGPCKEYLKKHKIYKANTKTRGVNLKSIDLALKVKIEDGGDDYLFVLPFNKEPWFVHARY
jgi:hypothetical protein